MAQTFVAREHSQNDASQKKAESFGLAFSVAI
jgi:hypothetical protein